MDAFYVRMKRRVCGPDLRVRLRLRLPPPWPHSLRRIYDDAPDHPIYDVTSRKQRALPLSNVMHVETGHLSDSDRLELLKLVRQSAEIALGGKSTGRTEFRPVAGSFGGVFVTFWRDGGLRGCVGSLSPTADVVQALPAVTQSALKDRRFVADPIRPAELDQLTIEVSLLSDMERITGSQEVEIGKHGILVRRQNRSGCFLPKVAVEQGWNSEQFLAECCVRKAGLPPDAWRDPQSEVFRFTAIVVSESKTVPKSCG